MCLVNDITQKDVKSEEKNWTVRRVVNQEYRIEEHKKEKKEKVIKWNRYSMRMKTSRKLWEKPNREGILKWVVNIVKLVKNCSVFGFENMWCATWVPLQDLLSQLLKVLSAPQGLSYLQRGPRPRLFLSQDSTYPMTDGCKCTWAWASQPELEPSERQL